MNIHSDLVVCVRVWKRGMSCTLWEQIVPLHRKDVRSNKGVGRGEGGRPGEWRLGFSGKRGKENTLSASQQNLSLCPFPSAPRPSPPTREKYLTISALQRCTTTNSASLTSHSKHSCASAFCLLSTYSRHGRFKMRLEAVCCGGGGHVFVCLWCFPVLRVSVCHWLLHNIRNTWNSFCLSLTLENVSKKKKKKVWHLHRVCAIL